MIFITPPLYCELEYMTIIKENPMEFSLHRVFLFGSVTRCCKINYITSTFQL